MATEDGTPRGVSGLAFDPDKHPHCVLKAFNSFVEQYEFRYDAQFPEVQKHVLDAGVEKLKSEKKSRRCYCGPQRGS